VGRRSTHVLHLGCKPSLHQYHRKRKKNVDMRPGWPEPRIMMLCNEDMSSSALSDFGPVYTYKDVIICGIHYDAIPGLQVIIEQFAKE